MVVPREVAFDIALQIIDSPQIRAKIAQYENSLGEEYRDLQEQWDQLERSEAECAKLKKETEELKRELNASFARCTSLELQNAQLERTLDEVTHSLDYNISVLTRSGSSSNDSQTDPPTPDIGKIDEIRYEYPTPEASESSQKRVPKSLKRKRESPRTILSQKRVVDLSPTAHVGKFDIRGLIKIKDTDSTDEYKAVTEAKLPPATRHSIQEARKAWRTYRLKSRKSKGKGDQNQSQRSENLRSLKAHPVPALACLWTRMRHDMAKWDHGEEFACSLCIKRGKPCLRVQDVGEGYRVYLKPLPPTVRETARRECPGFWIRRSSS